RRPQPGAAVEDEPVVVLGDEPEGGLVVSVGADVGGVGDGELAAQLVGEEVEEEWPVGARQVVAEERPDAGELGGLPAGEVRRRGRGHRPRPGARGPPQLAEHLASHLDREHRFLLNPPGRPGRGHTFLNGGIRPCRSDWGQWEPAKPTRRDGWAWGRPQTFLNGVVTSNVPSGSGSFW